MPVRGERIPLRRGVGERVAGQHQRLAQQRQQRSPAGKRSLETVEILVGRIEKDGLGHLIAEGAVDAVTVTAAGDEVDGEQDTEEPRREGPRPVVRGPKSEVRSPSACPELAEGSEVRGRLYATLSRGPPSAVLLPRSAVRRPPSAAGYLGSHLGSSAGQRKRRARARAPTAAPAARPASTLHTRAMKPRCELN